MVQTLEAERALAGDNLSENSCHLRTAHRSARLALQMLNEVNQRLELGVAVLVGAGIQRLFVWVDE